MPHVNCPNGHRLQVPDRQIGQVIKCPSCQTSFVAEAMETLASRPPVPVPTLPKRSERETSEGGFDFDQSEKSEDSERSPSSRRRRSAFGGAASLAPMLNSFLGKPCLFVGLLLVVLGRGCDATSMRSVARTDASYRQAQVTFQLAWDAKMSAIQQKLSEKNREFSEMFEQVGDKGDQEKIQKQRNDLQKEKSALEKSLNKLRSDQAAAQTKAENEDWLKLREASLKATNDHRMSIYWYEWVFILGTIVLVFGLLTLAFTSEGAERWVAYIMIAIITFSIYVGGAAWIESIVNSATSTVPSSSPIGGGPGRPPR